jgi:MoxR-like ATPase
VFELPPDFLVLATQNPREFEGTYPLPESQLDRFMLRIDVDYPERAAETEVLQRYGAGEPATSSFAALSRIDRGVLAAARAQLSQIHVAAGLYEYVLNLAQGSREHARLLLGLSTRGALALLRAARIAAGMRGADFVTPDDVKEVAVQVMAHRLVLSPEAVLDGQSDRDVVCALLAETAVPR